MICSTPRPTYGSISTIVATAPLAASHSAVSQPVALPPMTTMRSPVGHVDAAVEDLLRVEHGRAVDAGDRRDQRVGARGDQDRVGVLRLDRGRVDVDARVDLDAHLAEDPRLVVAELVARVCLLGALAATSSLPPRIGSRSQIETS